MHVHSAAAAACAQLVQSSFTGLPAVTVAGLSLGSAGLPAAAHAQDGTTVDQVCTGLAKQRGGERWRWL